MLARGIAVLAALICLLCGGALCLVAASGYAAARARALAEAERREGGYDEAWARLERALRRAPTSAELWADLGQTYRAAWYFRAQPELLDSAVAAYRRASDLSPLDAAPRAELAQTLALGGRFAQADRAYAEALARDPRNPGLIVDRARALEGAGHRDAALAQYRLAQRIKPNGYSQDAERRLAGAP